MDDIKKYCDEEQALSETADKKEKTKILLKRGKREKRNFFLGDLPLCCLGILFLVLCAISFGWIN